MEVRRIALVAALLLGSASCRKENNSADTDQATEELTSAQGRANESRRGVAANEADIEREKREVLAAQQVLADKEALLAQQRQALGSAQAGVDDARVAYAAAVAERLAKLDASLATLATRTDPASTDARTGLRARRDQLAVKLTSMIPTTGPGWAEYTKAVDTTFDAIEQDLQAANR